MTNAPHITAEADIGERDGMILRDTCLVHANNLFPLSIESIDVKNKRLVLRMTRPVTLRNDQERFHTQIKDIFTAVGLTDVSIDDPGEGEKMLMPLSLPSDSLNPDIIRASA